MITLILYVCLTFMNKWEHRRIKLSTTMMVMGCCSVYDVHCKPDDDHVDHDLDVDDAGDDHDDHSQCA